MKLLDEPKNIMITHFGLYWSKDEVFWGNPGRSSSGELLGKVKTEKIGRGRPLKENESESEPFNEYIGLYCLYDDHDALIYIGEAGLGTSKQNLYSRLRGHLSDSLSGCWERFSWFGRKREENTESMKCEIISALAQLEAITIAITNPDSNKQAGTFHGAKEVFQVTHSKAYGSLDTRIERITNKLDQILNSR